MQEHDLQRHNGYGVWALQKHYNQVAWDKHELMRGAVDTLTLRLQFPFEMPPTRKGEVMKWSAVFQEQGQWVKGEKPQPKALRPLSNETNMGNVGVL